MSQVLDQAATDDRAESDSLARSGEAIDHAPPDASPQRVSPLDAPAGFDYQPVPVLAPAAALLAALSLFSWWVLPLMGITLVAFVVSLVATRKIHASEGELGGFRIAAISLAVSGLLLVGGTAKHAYVIATEVPDGFVKLNFSHDISAYPIGQQRGRIAIAPEVAAHLEKDIFLKGYMFPMEQTEGLTSFLFVKDNQLCCFGKQVEQTDMMLVVLPEGRTFDYTTSMVSVGGTFRVEPSTMADQDNNVVYRLDAKLVEQSKTIF